MADAAMTTREKEKVPLLPIVATALLALATFVFQLGLLTYAVYALVGLFWISRWLAKNWSQSVQATRQCMRTTAEVGQTIPIQITVLNTGKWPVGWVLVEDLLPREAIIFEPPRLRVMGERLFLTMLRSGQSKSIYFQLQCNRRGYYQIGPTVVETGDLFGLHRRYKIGADPDFLLVYPEVLPIEGYDIASRRPVGEVRLTHRLFEDPTRISGVRAYQAGDPLNRVHWRATARTGILHSKIYEASTVAGATLLLDFHRGSHDPRHEPFRSELAITAAASLANCLYQLGQQVGIVTNGRDAADRIRREGYSHDWRTRSDMQLASQMLDRDDRLRPIVVPTRQGPDQFRAILETLARLELTEGLTLPELVNETDDRLPRDATIIAILPRVTEHDAIALGSLRRRGYAVTAAVNLFDEYEFAAAAGPLIAQGVEVRQLKDRDSIRSLCRRLVVG